MMRQGPIAKPRRGEKSALREQQRREDEIELRAAKRVWAASVSGVCAMCQAARREPPLCVPVTEDVREHFHNDLLRLEGHHLIPKGDLKREGKPPRVRYDLRLMLTLCRYHHTRHENFVERVPAELYPASVYEFAVEHDVLWRLERERDAG